MDACSCGDPESLGTHWLKEDGECCPPDCECQKCRLWTAFTMIEVKHID